LNLRLILAALGCAFLLAHLRALPQTLEDIDSINFAMGVESFDVAKHQPHPPGYPIFIAMAKASTRAVAVVAPGWDRDRRAAVGLAVWNVIAGALGAWVIFEFWMAAGLRAILAALAAFVAVSSPLFWLTASRPLTDTVGLVVALAVATLLLRGSAAFARDPAAGLPRAWLWGAAAAGFSIGLRSQVIWLTGGLLLMAVIDLMQRRHGGNVARNLALFIGAAAAGTLVWFVPLVWLTGGPSAYLKAVRSQGLEDLTGVTLLATRGTLRLFAESMRHTFVDPWQYVALANVVLVLALAGAVRSLRRFRATLGVVAVVFVPYLIFHLAFQETITIRYALPIVIPVAAFAVIGADFVGVRGASAAAVAVSVASVVLASPSLLAYADAGAPVFRVLQDMQRARPALVAAPSFKLHHQVWWGVRRAVEWYHSTWDLGWPPHPGDHEWLGIVKDFRDGGASDVWYLTDLSRNDVVLFDRRQRTQAGRYVLAPDVRALVGGTRLDSLSWWRIQQPGWMLGTGWAILPEARGITTTDRTGPHLKPAEAFLRRDARPGRLMIGGRYYGGSAPASVTVRLEGADIATFTVRPDPIWFVQWIELPAGVPAGASPYATLTVTVTSAESGKPSPELGLEQFDYAPNEEEMYALTDGWWEPEENPRTGLMWRWSSAKNTIVVQNAGRDLMLHLSGERPLKYFDAAPTVVVRAGREELGRFHPSDDFSETIRLPAAAVSAANGVVIVETDLTWVPAEHSSSPDRRHLGLRTYSVDIRR